MTCLGGAPASASPERSPGPRAAPYLSASAAAEQDGPSSQEQDAEAEKTAAVAHCAVSGTDTLRHAGWWSVCYTDTAVRSQSCGWGHLCDVTAPQPQITPGQCSPPTQVPAPHCSRPGQGPLGFGHAAAHWLGLPLRRGQEPLSCLPNSCLHVLERSVTVLP